MQFSTARSSIDGAFAWSRSSNMGTLLVTGPLQDAPGA